MFKNDLIFIAVLFSIASSMFMGGFMVGSYIGLNSANSSEFCNKE